MTSLEFSLGGMLEMFLNNKKDANDRDNMKGDEMESMPRMKPKMAAMLLTKKRLTRRKKMTRKETRRMRMAIKPKMMVMPLPTKTLT
jgi:hypothetical protein